MTKRQGFIHFLGDPPEGWARVVVPFGLGLAGEFVAAILSIITGNLIWLLLLLTVSCLAFLWTAYAAVTFWKKRRPPPLVLVPENEQPGKHRGLILLVGTGRPGEEPTKQSAWPSIEYHLPTGPETGLKYVWLIASTGEKGSLPVAQDLQNYCKQKAVEAFVRGVEAFEIQDTYNTVRAIYRQEIQSQGLTEDEVIADFTGATHPMAVGMALACGENYKMQYMYGRKEWIASVPRLVRFRAAKKGQR